jgi:hypothetical protein
MRIPPLVLVFASLVVATSPPAAAVAFQNREPATLAESLAAMDWMEFPRPEGATWIETSLFRSDFWLTGTLDEVSAKIGSAFQSIGWNPVPLDPAVNGSGEFRTLQFEKAGHLCEGILEAGTSAVKVSLHSRGNLDSRTLPLPPDGKLTSASFSVTAIEHQHSSDVLQTFYRKAMAATGWTESNETWSREWRFVKNGIEARIMPLPGEDGQPSQAICFTAIRRQLDPAEVRVALVAEVAGDQVASLTSGAAALETMNLGNLPRFSDFDEGSCTGLRLDYKAWSDVEKVMAHYEGLFRDQGWKLVTPYANVLDKGEANWVKDGCRVRLAIRTEEGQSGLVWISLVNHGRFDLRRLAFPPGAEIAAEPQLHHNSTFQFTAALSMDDTAKFYRDQLTAAGWSESDDLRFTLADQHIQLYLRESGPNQTATQLTTELE